MKHSSYLRTAKRIQLCAALLLAACSLPVKAENLHQHYGETQVLHETIDQFLGTVSKDVRVNHILFQISSAELKDQLLNNRQLRSALLRETGTAAAGMQLDSQEFGLLLQHLDQAMRQHRLSASGQERLYRRLSGLVLDPVAERPLASL